MLPKEMWIEIIKKIKDANTLRMVSQVCKQCKEIADDNTVWKPLFIKKFGVGLGNPNPNYKKEYQEIVKKQSAPRMGIH